MIQNIDVTGLVIIALRKTDLHQMMFPNQLTPRNTFNSSRMVSISNVITKLIGTGRDSCGKIASKGDPSGASRGGSTDRPRKVSACS
ncbi:hypothetical protein ACIQWQ_21775 [Peribacillus frigoritolerans]